MSLPKILKNFNLFNDGQSFLGQVQEVSMPKLALVVEAYRGAGMISEVDVDMGLEKLEMEVSYGGMMRPVLRQFGMVGLGGVMQRFCGAYQSEDDGDVMAAELVVRGKHVEIDMGGAKPGEKTEFKVKSTLSYLKWTINGRVEVEIDVLAPKFVVDGVDRYAAIREAMGGGASALSGSAPTGIRNVLNGVNTIADGLGF